MGYSKRERSTINMWYSLKKNFHITPLPAHNGHLSTTATFFCSQVWTMGSTVLRSVSANCWFARDVSLLWELNSFFMSIFRAKFLLYWPPTWPPCHVVANQESVHPCFLLYLLCSNVWIFLNLVTQLLLIAVETLKKSKSFFGQLEASLRKHPFLLALRRWGRFAAAKSEEKRMFSQASFKLAAATSSFRFLVSRASDPASKSTAV